jgi:hypothetical protein
VTTPPPRDLAAVRARAAEVAARIRADADAHTQATAARPAHTAPHTQPGQHTHAPPAQPADATQPRTAPPVDTQREPLALRWEAWGEAALSLCATVGTVALVCAAVAIGSAATHWQETAAPLVLGYGVGAAAFAVGVIAGGFRAQLSCRTHARTLDLLADAARARTRAHDDDRAA